MVCQRVLLVCQLLVPQACACCVPVLLLPGSLGNLDYSVRVEGQQVHTEVMAPRLPPTCLATLAFIMDHLPATMGFGLALGLGARPRISSRIRARPPASHARRFLVSTTGGKPDEDERIVVSPPERRPRADIDMSSVKFPLVNLNLTAAERPRQADSCEDETCTGTRTAACSLDSADGVSLQPVRLEERLDSLPIAAVQQQLFLGNVPEAISMLAEAVAASGQESREHVNDTAGLVAAVQAGFTAVLQYCAKMGLWREAKQVVATHMPAAGIEPSVPERLMAINACFGAGGSEHAVYQLHDMRMRCVLLLLYSFARYPVNHHV